MLFLHWASWSKVHDWCSSVYPCTCHGGKVRDLLMLFNFHRNYIIGNISKSFANSLHAFMVSYVIIHLCIQVIQRDRRLWSILPVGFLSVHWSCGVCLLVYYFFSPLLFWFALDLLCFLHNFFGSQYSWWPNWYFVIIKCSVSVTCMN